MIEFHLNTRSGVTPYLQLIHQVRQALRLGLLREGGELPTVKDAVARRWLAAARRAGLGDESFEALLLNAFRSTTEEEAL
jgi:hypothetical protein